MASPPGFRAVAAVTLQVGGVSVSAGLRCDAPSGFARGSVESFLVQVFRCCSCLFTCAHEGHMTSHLSSHLSPAPANQNHSPATATANQSHSPGHMMSPQEFNDTGEKEEDEDLFLYDMFDISAQGEELQVGHTCQVSSLFEEHCSLFKEDTDQSAHLRTLGLCRITAPPRSPPRSPPRPTDQTKTSHGPRRRSRPDRSPKVRPRSTKTSSDPPRLQTSPESTDLRPEHSPSPQRPSGPSTPADGKKKSWRKQQKKNPQKQKAFICSVCSRSFSSALTLRRHSGVHSDVRPFSCSLCPYSSRLKASLLQHQRTHTGERPFRCPVCSYASIDRSSLLRHQRTHSNEHPHRCPRCPYTSIQKKSLDLHLQRHHRPAPPSPP